MSPRLPRVFPWLLAFVACVGHQMVQAQDVPSWLSQLGKSGAYVFDTWTVEEGLPANTVTAVTRRRDGYLWIGTTGGLARFDGQAFTWFDRASTDGLASNRIQVLRYSRTGALWIGTEGGGLSRYADGRFTHFDATSGLPANTVLALAEDARGRLWIGTSSGLAVFDGTHVAPHRVPDHATVGVRALHVDRTGALWIGTEGGGLSRYADGRFTHFDATSGLPANTVLALAEDARGRLWIGTDGAGAFWRANERFEPVQLPEAPRGSQYVSAFHADADGTLWMATYGGLARMGERPVFITLRDGLPRSNLTTVFRGQEGNIWLGTDRGLVRLKAAVFGTFTEADGLADEVATAIYEDRRGTLWIGTRCGGVTRLTGDGISVLDEADGLSNPCVTSVVEDRTGAFWIGTRNGLNRWRQGQMETFWTRDGLANNEITAVYETRDGQLWVGTNGGLSRREGDRFVSLTAQDGLASDQVRGVIEDDHGHLWIATAGGLSHLRGGRFTTVEGVSSDDVRTLHVDGDGTLWVGTYDAGLNRIREGSVQAFTTRDGLADDRISVILEDSRGHLWLGGNRGVQRINKQALEAYGRGEIGRVPALLFGRESGLKNPECSGGFQPSGWALHSGRLVFPTLEGVAFVDPAAVRIEDTPPSVVIERILVGGRQMPLSDQLVLEPGQRNLEIRYTSTVLSAPGQIRFQFQLVGFDEEWVHAAQRRTAHYRGLVPGRYSFRVIASRDGLTWTPAATALGIVVKPMWFERTWIRLGLLLGLLAFMGVGSWHRIRLLRTRSVRLQHLVDERTRELRIAKEETEAALTAAEARGEKLQDAQLQVEDLSIQLLRMDHMKSRMFANIGHEFRTSLTLVLDLLEPLAEARADDPTHPLARKTDAAHRNARRLLRLTNQLLDLARLESGNMELHAVEADLVSFISEVVDAFQSGAEGRGIALSYKPEVDALPVFFDADKLEKVCFNLISNALKAMPAGGRAVVMVRRRAASEVGGEQAEIVIRDTGVGIPGEHLQHIFDRFYQGDTFEAVQREGSGIGLALAKELIELHRGEITAESVPGFGSTFSVRLPLGSAHLGVHERGGDYPTARQLRPEDYLEPVKSGTGSSREAQEVGRSPDTPTVLIVEDNADVRATLRDYLDPYFVVYEAAGGIEGWQRAQTVRPALIVSDMRMPGLDGVELCRKVRADERLQDTAFIILSADTEVAKRLEVLRAGADDYLTKPYVPAELITRARSLVQNRRAMQERFRQQLILPDTGAVVSSADAAFVERLLAFVDSHLADPDLSVPELADGVDLSQAQLKRRLRAILDRTPVELIRERRLTRAAALLAQQVGTVSEIAFAVGFDSASYFARCFREQFGVTPSAYAEEHRLSTTQGPKTSGPAPLG